MITLNYSNVNEVSKADIVIIGVPDESKSHARRKGTIKGPDILRRSSNESNFFERGGKTIPICPMRGIIDGKCIFDYGNIRREDLYRLIFETSFLKKNSHRHRRRSLDYYCYIACNRGLYW